MKEFDASNYTISIVRRNIDGHFYFVGTVREFPNIAVYEENWTNSYEAVQAILEDLYTESIELNESFPQPIIDEENYSGRVTTRLPKWLHSKLDAHAKSESVSLNTHIVSLLTLASANRTYARISMEAPVISERKSEGVVIKRKLPSVIQNFAQDLNVWTDILGTEGLLDAGFTPASAVHKTEIQTYRQELPHDQETRH